MSVISIRRKRFLGNYNSQSVEIVPEWAGFFAGAALTFFGPAILYYVGSGQLFLLYLMTILVALGTVIGIAMFKWSAGDFLLRIPVAGIPRVPSGTRMGRLKKAA